MSIWVIGLPRTGGGCAVYNGCIEDASPADLFWPNEASFASCLTRV